MDDVETNNLVRDEPSDKEARPLVENSPGWNWLKIVGVALVIIFVAGAGPGFAGIRQTVLDGGVFSSYCSDTDPKCHSQSDTLAMVASMTLISMNLVNLPFGMVKDHVNSNRKFGTALAVAWTVAVAMMGISPANGVLFTLGFIVSNFSACGMFLVLTIDFAVGACPPESEPTVRSIWTGLCDLGAVTYVTLGAVYFTASPPLWLLFFVYAILAGGATIWFVYRHAPADFPKVSGDTLNFTHFLKIPFTWVCVTNSIMPITYGYFFLSTVVDHMEWKGASNDEAVAYNEVFSWMFPILGMTASFLASYMLHGLRPDTLRKAYLFQALLGTLMGIFALAPGPLWIQYLTFAFVILFRMFGFCIIHASLPAVFPFPHFLGRLMALCFSVGGLIGLCDSLAVYLALQLDYFFAVHFFFCAWAVIFALIGAYRVGKDLDSRCRVVV